MLHVILDCLHCAVSTDNSHTVIFRFKSLGGIIMKKTLESLEEVGDFITTESRESLSHTFICDKYFQKIDSIMFMLAYRCI